MSEATMLEMCAEHLRMKCKVEALEAENARLRAALGEYADEENNWAGDLWIGKDDGVEIARRALGMEESNG